MVTPIALTIVIALSVLPREHREQEARAESAPQVDASRPPPVQRIAGLEGFHALSTLVFVAAPDRPHRLDATYVFPERARLWLGVGSETATSRQIHYRFGSHAYEVRDKVGTSTEIQASERDAVLRYIELRRAWMMWPDGFEWQRSGTERTASLGSVGVLRAHCSTDGDSRPVQMESLDADGKVQDELKALTWRPESGGRVWPASAEMWHAGELAWRERIDSVDAQGRFVDSYFLPADRRPGATDEHRQDNAIQCRDLPPTCGRRFELPNGASWDAARAEDARLRHEWTPRLRELGLDIDGRATVEVSAEGEPRAVFLRLATVPVDPPAGFAIVPARQGLTAILGSLQDVTRTQIARLVAAIPPGRRTEPPYVRFPIDRSPPSQVLVVLPLGPKD